jgi:hypothetical protein
MLDDTHEQEVITRFDGSHSSHAALARCPVAPRHGV